MRSPCFADWLLERDEPLGHFIQLSLKQERAPFSAKELTRLRGLVKKHRKEWLGPIAALTNSQESRFRRGFLSTWVLLTDAPPAAWEAVRDQPGLATVEALRCWGTDLPRVLALLREPTLSNLKSLNLYSGMLQPLCEGPPAWKLSAAELGFMPDTDDLNRLSTAPAFASLKWLSIWDGQRGPILDSPIGSRLEELCLSTMEAAATRVTWLTDVNDLPANVQAVTLRSAANSPGATPSSPVRSYSAPLAATTSLWRFPLKKLRAANSAP